MPGVVSEGVPVIHPVLTSPANSVGKPEKE